MKSGAYDVQVIDAENNTGEMKFTITAGAKLSASSGAVGSQLNVTGSGFIPSGPVVIKFDMQEVLTINADNAGEFSGTFDVPPAKGGRHNIIVTDGVSTRQMAYNIESVPPPFPKPFLPANNTGTRAAAYFDWEDVQDPSQPVVYRLQLASDLNFSSMVLDKQGITASEYKLIANETLVTGQADTYYYWRIRAMDAASNEGEWSAPWAFYISPPPSTEPLLPIDGSKALSQAEFDWVEVVNLSPPITYVLQIARDPNFKDIVLEKTGLKDSGYTITEDERLAAVQADAPYYWRVKAVDSAGNESNWSEVLSFQVGFSLGFPAWALALLAGIGIILLGWGAFWLGRRTAFSRPSYP
jgi:hypothetical protein